MEQGKVAFLKSHSQLVAELDTEPMFSGVLSRSSPLDHDALHIVMQDYALLVEARFS